MSGEMRRKANQTTGQAEIGMSGRHGVGAGIHASWAAAIVRKFARTLNIRCAERPSVIDLLRRRSKIILQRSQPVSYVDRRRSTRYESRTIKLHQWFTGIAGNVRAPAVAEVVRNYRRDSGHVPQWLSRTPMLVHVVGLPKESVQAGGRFIPNAKLPALVRAGGRIDSPLAMSPRLLLEAQAAVRNEALAARVARRHQRTETNSVASASQIAADITAPVRRRVIEADLIPTGRRGRELGSPDETVPQSADFPRGVDVTQVADEVMKQLDRRLVAARERMGRI
jgi:hypothetical protein